MGVELYEILKDVRAASENITAAESEHKKSRAELKISAANLEGKFGSLESSVNELWWKANRPGFDGGGDRGADLERKDARELCVLKHELEVPKNDGHAPAYEPSSVEIDAALIHRKALKNLFRHGDPARLDQLERKSLANDRAR